MNNCKPSESFNGSCPSFFKPSQLAAVLNAHSLGITKKLWTDYTMVFGDFFTCFSSVDKGYTLRSITAWKERSDNNGFCFSVEEGGQSLVQTNELKEALGVFQQEAIVVEQNRVPVLGIVK